ncbi:hypothetical protein [Corynebacterium resistens]|nr:hypothetical protein [Corynebacterium resistens]
MSNFLRDAVNKGADVLFTGNRATIDAIRLAPPLPRWPRLT